MVLPPVHLVLVFLGGGLGAVLRYAVTVGMLALLGPRFPWGTFLINVSGSAVMGVTAALIAARWQPGGAGDLWRLFLMTGVLGGYTTFSAFSLDAFLLWERGQGPAAILYAAGSVVLSIGALVAAVLATRLLVTA